MSRWPRIDGDGYVEGAHRRFLHVDALRELEPEAIAGVLGVTVDELLEWGRGPALPLGLPWALEAHALELGRQRAAESHRAADPRTELGRTAAALELGLTEVPSPPGSAPWEGPALWVVEVGGYSAIVRAADADEAIAACADVQLEGELGWSELGYSRANVEARRLPDGPGVLVTTHG